MVGELSIANHIRQTHIRFRDNFDYESFINAIDQNYETEDAIFNGYIYKIDTPQFNLYETSQYGNGCDFKHEIIEYRGKKCCIPTKAYCFVKRVLFITGEDYKQQKLDVIRNRENQIF